MSVMWYQLVLLFGLVTGIAHSQDCSYPTSEDLEEVIAQIIISTDESSSMPTVGVINFYVVCLAFSDQRDHYRAVSVVVKYTCSGHGSCPVGTAVEQVESECQAGDWSIVSSVPGSTEDTRSQTPLANSSTAQREDCAFCFSPDLAERVSLRADSVTHCVACDWTCKRGHERCFGLSPSVCQESGNSSSSSSCCNFYHGSSCVDSCPSPYIADDTNDCVCPVGTTGHDCGEAVDCGCLGTPDDGVVVLNETTYSSLATYLCHTGYMLMGNGTRTCLESGMWSGSEPACTVADCRSMALTDPDHGTVSFSATVYDSVASYSCDTGYTLNGDSERKCLESGEWSGNPPTCSLIDCGTLTEIERGRASLSFNTAYNSMATYSCDDGYTLVGNNKRECLVTGIWSGNEPFCLVVDCGCPQVTNGTVSVQNTTYTSVAKYSCNAGYTLMGDENRTCQTSGSWSGAEPTCSIAENDGRDDQGSCNCDPCPAGAVGGALGAILGILILVSVAANVVLIWLLRKRAKVRPSKGGDNNQQVKHSKVAGE